jgi:hypothetical protein
MGGFVAGLSGVLGVWYRGNISPGSVDVARTIDVLIIAVIGGLGYPIGAFVGAVVFVLIDVFASSIHIELGDFIDFSFDERFNSLIGLGFVLIVLLAPNGLVALVDRGRAAGSRRLPFLRPGVTPLATSPVATTPTDAALAGPSHLPDGESPPESASEGGGADRDA